MFSSIFILVFSLAVLVYWAHFTCNGILARGRTREEAERIAEANRLEFQRIRNLLETVSDPGAYDGFRDALRHDFLALTYLLRYAATVQVGKYSNEERLLIADFHAMRMVYRLGRLLSPRAARYALLEMSSILEYFASVMSRRMVAFSTNLLEV